MSIRLEYAYYLCVFLDWNTSVETHTYWMRLSRQYIFFEFSHLLSNRIQLKSFIYSRFWSHFVLWLYFHFASICYLNEIKWATHIDNNESMHQMAARHFTNTIKCTTKPKPNQIKRKWKERKIPTALKIDLYALCSARETPTEWIPQMVSESEREQECMRAGDFFIFYHLKNVRCFYFPTLLLHCQCSLSLRFVYAMRDKSFRSCLQFHEMNIVNINRRVQPSNNCHSWDVQWNYVVSHHDGRTQWQPASQPASQRWLT